MLRQFTCVFSSAVVLTTGAATIAAPGQTTARPGEPTQARVWIGNRGPAEAVPVTVQDLVASAPIGVRVVGTPTVLIEASSTLPARSIRQPWEYRTISVPRGQDPIGVLGNLGTEGWEVTGLQFPDQSATVVVLKRPR
jgi:hypothetical protein